MRQAFPAADGLHKIAPVIVSTTADKIRVLDTFNMYELA